ncbi:hypothetical protein Brsp02_01039 [Brucella sp. NBRC 113783]
MHLVVSWDITDGANRSNISDEMISVLKPYSWYRPLTTFYIIKTDLLGRDAIISGLNAIARKYPGRTRFVVSPLMQGTYQGILNNNDWTEINQRTN